MAVALSPRSSGSRRRWSAALGSLCAALTLVTGPRAPVAQGASAPPAVPIDLLPLEISRDDAALVTALAAPPTAASNGAPARAQALLQALAPRAAWKAAAIATRIAGQIAPAATDPSLAPAQDRLHKIADAWTKSPSSCARLREGLERFVAGVERKVGMAPPIDAAIAAGACQLPPMSIDAHVRFLTVLAGEGERAEIVVLGPSFLRLADPPALDVKGRRLFLAAVPLNARVLVVVAGPSPSAAPSIPSASYMLVDGDHATRLPRPACLDLSRVKTSDGARLFVNGVEVLPGAASLTLRDAAANGDAGLAARIEVYDAEGRRRLQRDIAAPQVVGSLACTAVEGDATAGSKKTVLLMVTSNGPACADLAVDPLKIRAQVKDMLDSGSTDGEGGGTRGATGASYETRGIEVIDALKTITDFQTMLRSFEGGAAAAQTGAPATDNADVARALQDVGFSIAFTIDVRCAHLPAGDVQFTVVGQRVDIDRLIEASSGSERDRRMDAIGEVLSSQIETQVGDQSLRGLLKATVGRLFHMPYARFTDASFTDAQRGDVTFSMEAALSGQRGDKVRADMTATLVASAGAHDAVCSNIADRNAVRSTERQTTQTTGATTTWTNHAMTELRRRADADARGAVASAAGNTAAAPPGAPEPLWLASVAIPFYPVEPGQYVIDVTLTREGAEGKPALHAYRCLTVAEPGYLAWVEVDQLTGIESGRRWRNESNSTTYVLGGLVRRTGDAYSFGLLAGLGYARYQADAPPSWSDISRSAGPGQAPTPADAVVFAPDGKVDLGWSKVSVAVALPFERRLFRLASLIPAVQESRLRASAFYVNATALVDVGWYSVETIPVGLRDIRGGAQKLFDVDGSLLLSLLFKAHLSDGQSVALGFRAGWLGFDDWGGLDKRRQARITYDNWLSLGVHVGFGWHP